MSYVHENPAQPPAPELVESWQRAIDRLAYSPAEFAEAIGVTRQHIHNLINRGDLRAVKVGRCTRIPASEAVRLFAGDAR